MEISGTGVALWQMEPNVLRTRQLSHRGHVIKDDRIVLDGPRESRLAGAHLARFYPGR